MNRLEHTIDGNGLWKGRLLQFDALPSTNRWARDHLGMLTHGDVVWCKKQTAGRGRLNRTWLSPDDRGLTLSIIIIDFGQEFIHLLGLMAALAVRNTLSQYDITASLKWPNDILVNGKKIAGILAEADFNRNAVVLGIGLNVNFNGHDIEQINHPITSMRMEKGNPFGVNEIRERLLEQTENTIDTVMENGSEFLIKEWSKYDWLKGSSVGMLSANKKFQGKYNGMDENGRIRIIVENGHEEKFWAGDVEKFQII